MVKAECYNCKSTSYTFFESENGYDLVKCINCKLLFIETPPSLIEISTAQKQGVHRGSAELEVTGSFDKSKLLFFENVIQNLFDKKELIHKKWLDIGCGYGELMQVLKKTTNNRICVKGSEPNNVKREFAKRNNLDVDFTNLENIEEKYDVISLLNVYSHLPNPIIFLENLKKILATKGELLIETGDTTLYTKKTIPKPLYLPDHLSFTTQDNLIQLLGKLGFKVIAIEKYPIIDLNFKVFLKELLKLFLPNYSSKIKYFFNKRELIYTDMFIRAKRI